MRLRVLSRAAHRRLVSEYAVLEPTSSFAGATCDGEVTASGWDARTWTTAVPVAGRPALIGAVLRMQVHTAAGLWVDAGALPVAVGTTLVQSIGVGPLRMLIPTRVVRVVDEPGRSGFAYATLRGHPEDGEEAFVVEQLPDGSWRFRVTALSRPASFLVRWSGPLGGLAQQAAVHRYLRAARRIAGA
ncbi:MAG: hypothetical protein QOJ92_1703 [Frankiales bacterium]|nr:hypothetical protein [Frankiales bacterium]